MAERIAGISRRNFLTGAGIAAAGAAAWGLTGCAPKAKSETATTGAASATATTGTVGFDGTGVLPWLEAEPEIAESAVGETLQADVIIVGLGATGPAAARAAAEAGAKVLCFEKSATLNSVASDIAALGGETQDQWGRGDGFLDKDMIVKRHMDEGSYHTNFSIIERWCRESGSTLDWFIGASKDLYIAPETWAEIPSDSQSNYLAPFFVPMPETYDWTKEDLPCYPTSVTFSNLKKVQEDNLQVAVDAGAEVRYSCPVAKLIVENGVVKGVYAKEVGSDKYIKATASSVVLCTGDYLGNEAMMKFYEPETVENGVGPLCITFDADGKPTNVGDGHKMAVWAGAAIEQWHAPMIHHMGGGAGADGRGVMGNNGYLWLNLHGKRFMNEDLPGQQLENQVELQPDRVCYQFFDAAWPEQLEYFPAAHGVACIYREDELPAYTANGLKINVRTPADLEAAVADGRCLTSDTIEGLLAQIEGIDVATAKASIERYNEVCASGTDTDFGKSPQRLFGLTKAPFYAAKSTTALNLGALGGAVSDEDCHVFTAEGKRIEGLYVAGGPQGGRFAVEYPISMKGLSMGMCITFGRIAGQNAAAGK